MKEVTAAIITKHNKVLIAPRAPEDKLAGKWEFPGGKTEHGETLQECLKREIREELDVDIEVLDFFGESRLTDLMLAVGKGLRRSSFSSFKDLYFRILANPLRGFNHMSPRLNS